MLKIDQHQNWIEPRKRKAKQMNTMMKTALCIWAFLMFAALEPARAFYDPGTQRWLTRDPIGESGGYNLYASVANDPLDRFDPFGEADAPKDKPPKTSPPIFGGKPFEKGTDNCLCYGLDTPGGAKQPDGGSGNKNGQNCKDLLAQIKKNYGGTDVPNGGACPPGSHKIGVFSDEGTPGYHIQRQDSGGKWSEMSKNPDTSPHKCKRGGPGTDCGNLCVPDQPPYKG